MPGDFESNLKKYGELAVRVGLNLQPDQRLIVRAPIAAAELVRAVAASAYDSAAATSTSSTGTSSSS